MIKPWGVRPRWENMQKLDGKFKATVRQHLLPLLIPGGLFLKGSWSVEAS